MSHFQICQVQTYLFFKYWHPYNNKKSTALRVNIGEGYMSPPLPEILRNSKINNIIKKNITFLANGMRDKQKYVF